MKSLSHWKWNMTQKLELGTTPVTQRKVWRLLLVAEKLSFSGDVCETSAEFLGDTWMEQKPIEKLRTLPKSKIALRE